MNSWDRLPARHVIIGAPFGNWFRSSEATSTLGTFTLRNRGHLPYRLWRCLRTLRPLRGTKGWVNKLGLPNPGLWRQLQSKPLDFKGAIVSIKGFNKAEWGDLAGGLFNLDIMRRPLAVEFNLSCPNVDGGDELKDITRIVKGLLGRVRIADPSLIFKLPPVRWMDYVDPLYDMGARVFHLCNTIPVPQGGVSGYPVKPYSLWAIQEIKAKYSDVTLIGGGGIYTVDDAEDYQRAGADHVAVASALLSPFRWGLPKAVAKNWSTSTGCDN